jgi:hypothetical protein
VKQDVNGAAAVAPERKAKQFVVIHIKSVALAAHDR